MHGISGEAQSFWECGGTASARKGIKHSVEVTAETLYEAAVLGMTAQNIPWFLGGWADLGPSNKTILKYEGAGDFQADNPGGKNLHYGIRERDQHVKPPWPVRINELGRSLF
jgi:transketolase